mmetsp:Transcript_26345/g.63517  ORF Transcript_26345/g.63517 Transcript_26345/m.63517 type:complete len:122 (-) Transcript_26345:368-733(-)|eukprot:CAMPEP_0114517438 /NCGR_PEP_ID=MMETSP0109-20121206/17891_1 /TAXON_ID=29199 /ORGANISM="Chlorarachnion reptans, Strain CCCM449" /LENGTH=121 /DNA_ID=CAMNT_0001697953 /DNA_START=168 /DNA_END=533 /DNA_ORIENTATION=+
MGRYRPKRTQKGKLDHKKAVKVKRRKKDLDQIQDEIKLHVPSEAKDAKDRNRKKATLPFDPDLPGLGQFYCAYCARYFINATTQKNHERTKDHKKQIKKVREEQYTQKEAEEAAGLGTSNT